MFLLIMVFCWCVFLLSFLQDRTRYINCYLLFIAVLSCLLFVINLSETYFRELALVVGYFIIISLLSVPYFLLHNGYVMLKNEGKSFAHMLSLLLGIVILVGELAFIFNIFSSVFVYGFEAVKQLQHSFFYMFSLFVGVSVLYFSITMLVFVWYLLFLQVFPVNKKCNSIIILGAGLLEGERVSKLLSDRIDKAISIYHACFDKPLIIPSGGKGEDEKISEAEAMKRYLLDKGIPEESIVLEDESKTTYENIVNSKRILDAMDGEKNTVVVSSNFHVYRALKIAKSVGLKCTGAGGHTAFYFWPSAVIREYAAIHAEKKRAFLFVLGWVLCVLLCFYNYF